MLRLVLRRETVRTVRLLAFAISFFYQTTEIVSAAGLGITNCPEWLAAADSFLDDCHARARFFARTFYPSGGDRGEREENGAWFSSAPADSHFLMGCTLRYDRALSFLGIYYTAEPSAIAQANTAPILGIGFDGDVVLSVDGHPVTFTAVQPFDTPKVKTRWSGSSTIGLNCHSPLGQDGGYHVMRSNTFADLSRFDADNTVAVGAFQNTTERFRYMEIFPSTLPRQIIYSWGNQLLIMASGSILVRTDWFPSTCHKGNSEMIANSPLLLHQLCRIQRVK